MRRAPILVASLLLACASRTAEPRSADTVAAAESLPRHLTVELHPDGSLELDGEATPMEQLQSKLSKAWQSGEFAAALLWADTGTPQTATQRVLDIFLRAGIAQWRFAWRTRPASPAMAAGEGPRPSPPSPAAPAMAAGEGLKSSPPSSGSPATEPMIPPAPATTPIVNLKTIGLHVGGGPNDEATRRPLVALLELSFPELRRCAAQLSPLPTQLTSFGIDLYVGAKGGHAEARQIRTRLGPEAFRVCVKQALTALDFPPPPQPRVISYSVGFSPVSPSETR